MTRELLGQRADQRLAIERALETLLDRGDQLADVERRLGVGKYVYGHTYLRDALARRGRPPGRLPTGGTAPQTTDRIQLSLKRLFENLE
jgi:hypothetical protein